MNLALNLGLKNFLNCYLLGKDNYSVIKHEANDYLEINLPKLGVTLWVKLDYYSLTSRHQLSFPVYQLSGNTHKLIDFWQVIDFVLEELRLSQNLPTANLIKFREQIENSLHNQELTLTNITEANGLTAPDVDFALSEASLLSGHQLHPSPKSCFGFSKDEYLKYYPEFANAFQLHYFLVSQDCVHHDSRTNVNLSGLIDNNPITQEIPEDKFIDKFRVK